MSGAVQNCSEHIGAPLSMRRRTIFVQTFVFFLLPLAIACLQSLFIVKGLANVLYEVGFDGYPVSFLQTIPYRDLRLHLLFFHYLLFETFCRGDEKVNIDP